MGLDTTGTKPVLLERLEAALASAGGAAGEEGDKAEGADEELEDPTAGEDAAEAEAEADADAGEKAPEAPKEDGEADVPSAEVMDPAVARKLAELEKKKARAEKFGTEFSEKDKAEMRRLRFGPEKKAPKNGKQKKQPQPQPPKQQAIEAVPVSEEEMLKRKKRMERFGLKRPGVEELALQEEARRQAKKQAYVLGERHMRV